MPPTIAGTSSIRYTAQGRSLYQVSRGQPRPQELASRRLFWKKVLIKEHVDAVTETADVFRHCEHVYFVGVAHKSYIFSKLPKSIELHQHFRQPSPITVAHNHEQRRMHLIHTEQR